MAGALGVGIVTAAVGGTYLLSENDAVFPFAVAACVATFSSVLLRFALVGITGGAANNRARVRHFRHHRHFTGERAAYVRTSQRLAMMDRDFTAADYDLLLDLDNNSQRLRRFLEGASMETVSRLPTFIFRDVAKERNEAHANEDENATSNNITDIDQTTEPESRDDQSADDEDVKPSKSSDSKAVDRLQYITSDDSELAGATSKSCTICLEDFEEGMKIRILPCFHRFMAECIDPWLVQQARCPVCKCGIQDVMNTSMQEVMNTLPSGCS